MRPRALAFPGLAVLLAPALGCGAAPPRPEPPPGRPSVVQMEPLRITAHTDQDGRVRLEAYDAEALFRAGTEALEAGRCEEAVRRYRQLADEFPESRALSAALYNAGWCLSKERRYEEAIAFFERLLRERPDSPDVRDARFLLAAALFETEHWARLQAVSEALLEDRSLEPDERIEAMSYRALALLGRYRRQCRSTAPPSDADGASGTEHTGGDTKATGSPPSAPAPEPACDTYLQGAFRQARATLSLGRWEEQEGEPPSATDALAAAQFTIGEVYRLRAEAIALPAADVTVQHEALERRARLTLEAQRAYTDTVRWGVPRWSAPAGYRIGALYDGLWRAIDEAPIPPPTKPMRPAALRFYEQEYRRELRQRIRPLLRHAIRYWELTLMLIERKGVEGPWARRVRAGLREVRARLAATQGDLPEAGATNEGVAAEERTPDAAAAK